MRYQAVIFDFDGTLAYTLEDLADSMNTALGEFGFPRYPLEPYNYFVGRGMLNLARSAAPEGTDQATLEKIRDRMNELYDRNWANKTRPYPGIPELLAELRKRDLRLAVFSNKPDAFTQVMAKHFFPGDFDYIAGAKDDVPIKPDPTGALAIAKHLGVPAEAFIYLGDTNTDMRTGLAAGMFTVGVTWGFRPVTELREAGAQAIIDRPDEVLGFLTE